MRIRGNASGDKKGPELFIGLAGAVGTDLELVESAISKAFNAVGYQTHRVRLTSLLTDQAKFLVVPRAPLDAYIDKMMDAGDSFREKCERNDAMCLLAMAEIKRSRRAAGVPEGEARTNYAYIIRQLKHPDEVTALRRIYGSNFYLVAAYASHANRRNELARRIARSRNERADQHLETAEHLIKRDQQEESIKHGQNLRDTFHRADVFVDATEPSRLGRHVARFVELVFGNTFHTPTKPEYAMFHAYAASLRSAELGRQVGCVIANPAADVVAVGVNEVPKAGGGLYWCGDQPDKREFVMGFDSNSAHKREILADTLELLRKAGWLDQKRRRQRVEDLVVEAVSEKGGGRKRAVVPKEARIRNLIEFGRAVHAEMAAITDAARRGVAVAGCTMYSTTFPCHLCARHIVAAGIDRLQYIEPYPRSLAVELYPDSIALETCTSGSTQVLFEPFIGVAPVQYLQLFTANQRSDGSGRVRQFDPGSAVPRHSGTPAVYIGNEDEAADVLRKKIFRRDRTLR